MRSLLSDQDLYLFNEGTHLRLYDKLGAHPRDDGTHFAVWAPNASAVGVMGDWNGWDADRQPLTLRGPSGIWEGFVPGVAERPNDLQSELAFGHGGAGVSSGRCSSFTQMCNSLRPYFRSSQRGSVTKTSSTG